MTALTYRTMIGIARPGINKLFGFAIVAVVLGTGLTAGATQISTFAGNWGGATPTSLSPNSTDQSDGNSPGCPSMTAVHTAVPTIAARRRKRPRHRRVPIRPPRIPPTRLIAAQSAG